MTTQSPDIQAAVSLVGGLVANKAQDDRRRVASLILAGLMTPNSFNPHGVCHAEISGLAFKAVAAADMLEKALSSTPKNTFEDFS